MPQNYEVEKVSQEVREFDGKYGQMRSFTLKLRGLDRPVEVAQMASTPAPKAGDEIFGDIQQDEKFGPKLRKAQKPREGVFAGKGKPAGDSYAMFLSYSKDLAIAVMQNSKEGEFNRVAFDAIVDSVSQAAHVLWTNRPDSTDKPAVPASHPEADSVNFDVPASKDDINLDEIPF